jgi:hypothetical protein
MQTIPVIQTTDFSDLAKQLKARAQVHHCHEHALFGFLEEHELNRRQITALLANYNRHAGLLRRLLLLASSLMPEDAVTYVLENVRNEYGNGNPNLRHELQLLDLAEHCGISREDLDAVPISSGVRNYTLIAPGYYFPFVEVDARHLYSGTSELHKAAVAAGAITATEYMAIKEFQYLQKAFTRLGYENHIWFEHVSIEVEHQDESIALADYFMRKHNLIESLLHGFDGMLDANNHLYDGLLQALRA